MFAFHNPRQLDPLSKSPLHLSA